MISILLIICVPLLPIILAEALRESKKDFLWSICWTIGIFLGAYVIDVFLA